MKVVAAATLQRPCPRKRRHEVFSGRGDKRAESTAVKVAVEPITATVLSVDRLADERRRPSLPTRADRVLLPATPGVSTEPRRTRGPPSPSAGRHARVDCRRAAAGGGLIWPGLRPALCAGSGSIAPIASPRRAQVSHRRQGAAAKRTPPPPPPLPDRGRVISIDARAPRAPKDAPTGPLRGGVEARRRRRQRRRRAGAGPGETRGGGTRR